MAKAYDFTEGSIFKKMLLFSGPIFLTNLLQTSYQFIDSIWVGNLLGANALGAISVSAVVIFTVLSFIIGINRATLTVLSQQKGKKDEKTLKEALNAFIIVLSILSVSFGVIGYLLTDWILHILRTPIELFDLAKTYLHLNFMGIVFLFGYNFIGTVLRALGDSKTPILFVALAVILNTILDPILISTFNMGMKGAALATVISQGFSFVFGIVYSIKKSKIPFVRPHFPSLKYTKMIFKLGIPSGLQMMVISGGALAIMSVVTVFGDHVVAGYGAAQRIDSLILLPAFTLGSAVNSMAGQNIGADKWDRVYEIAKSAILMILILMFSLSLFVFLFGEWLMRMFVDDKETIEFGTLYMKTIAFFYPFLGINFVLNGIIRANGAMFQVLILNVISFWILRYPLSKMLSSYMGPQGIAYGVGISLIISSVLAFLYYRYGKWREIRVLEA